VELTRKYKNPPLVEAICEFTLKESEIPLSQIEAEFGAAVSKHFPNKRERKDIAFVIRQKEAKLTHEVQEAKGLTQYVSEDGVVMAQTGRNIFAVNHLKPYKSWESFEPIILENLKIFLDCSKHSGIERVSVRYINKIEIPSGGIKISDYFNYKISVPTEVSSNISNVLMQTEHVYDNDILTILFHSTPPENDTKTCFVFDINYGMFTTELDLLKLKDWLKVAHNRLNSVFENSLTEKCKIIFDT